MQNSFTAHFESFTFLQAKRQADFYNERRNGFKIKKIQSFCRNVIKYITA